MNICHQNNHLFYLNMLVVLLKYIVLSGSLFSIMTDFKSISLIHKSSIFFNNIFTISDKIKLLGSLPNLWISRLVALNSRFAFNTAFGIQWLRIYFLNNPFNWSINFCEVILSSIFVLTLLNAFGIG